MARSRKGAEVLASARRLFLERGFGATTIDDIAVHAGVSKATVYSNFHDKEALLVALMEQVSGEAAAIIAAAVEPLRASGPLEDRLQRVATALVDGALQPGVVQLRRLAISEGARIPAVAVAFWSRGPARSLALLEEAFDQLGIDNPRAAARHFAYALLGPLQDQALLLPDVRLTPEERAAHVRDVTRYFLNSVGATPVGRGPAPSGASRPNVATSAGPRARPAD